ncbi:hypothetical protein BCR37DRAFT_29149 [Protomyces lactucae-debilis]|uniref:Alpha/Beta hydrolase protein n=1 Tax=Protomyces lactucae-debilis TaxID=2754530 RepID=A0A1Y2FDQ5_PROLT|nr:uncharacterized protein BCR37DRAFT_29149 [Protomyces lactucae-debilis]ORY82058.1 hypothetical protein BCR37DRAFT_29149 [Protomyces lactucae-debilis]
MYLYSILSVVSLACAQRPQSARAGISPPRPGATAPDGSLIIDNTVLVDGLRLRYKLSVPPSLLVGGASADPAARPLGLNVLLHGDGGASFEDFPHAGVRAGLLGCVVLAPNDALLWGGQSTRATQRPDGVAHAAAVNTLIRSVLPNIARFDPEQVWFTGVSGGSLLLSGFFAPAFMAAYKTGIMFLCGGLAPPARRVTSTLDTATLSKIRLHWQSSQNELVSLKTQIPGAIRFFEDAARTAGVDQGVLDKLQTVDATPTGSHCAFDNRGFNSGIAKMMEEETWSRIMFRSETAASVGVTGREDPFRRQQR